MTWTLEDAKLVGDVYDRYTSVHFSEYASEEDLAAAWPAGHYVWTTHERLEPLVNAFERLWLVERMLLIDSFPLHGPDNSFVSRAEWLRVTHEVLLVRLAAVRDLTALLVAATLELNVPVRAVSIPKIRKLTPISAVAGLRDALDRVAHVGPSMRDERNRLLHEGKRRPFGPHQLFDTAAHMEAIGLPIKVEPFPRDDGTVREFDLATQHATLARQLTDEFTEIATELRAAVIVVLDLLQPEWASRLRAKGG